MTVFDKAASESYHRHAGLLRLVYRLIAADLTIAPGSVVVDVGTGLAERLTFARGAAEELPFDDASVGLVVSSLSLR